MISIRNSIETKRKWVCGSLISIYIPIEYKDSRYELLSTGGAVVQHGILLSNTLDISSVKPGMYVLRLKSANTFRILKKR